VSTGFRKASGEECYQISQFADEPIESSVDKERMNSKQATEFSNNASYFERSRCVSRPQHYFGVFNFTYDLFAGSQVYVGTRTESTIITTFSLTTIRCTQYEVLRLLLY
jgi:hypothetical protein